MMTRPKQKIKSVTVLMGGKSVERPISLISGEACAISLEKKGYSVRRVDTACHLNDLIGLLTPKPDVVFNALHGRYGEDGRIQAMLDFLQIPYTHSGVTASSLAMNKQHSKMLLSQAGMPVARDKVFSRSALMALNDEPMERPFVLKPVSEGSSLGVHLFLQDKNISLKQVLKNEQADLWMIEDFIKGCEFTVTVKGGEALAVTELKPSTEFYNFKAKYIGGIARHILPARIDMELENELKRLSVLAHDFLGCRGISRSDFIADPQTGPVYLETNTQPGMTELSLVPEQARFVGIDFDDLVQWIVEQATCDA